tara:strand:- start:55 stop:528 length:474 start_codon:yes stop_codon:yes gene_type:complete
MIITCPNCKKQFKIDDYLIPEEGRDLQCGSCKNVWFYKTDDDNSSLLTLNEDFSINKNESISVKPQIKETKNFSKSTTSTGSKKKESSEIKNKIKKVSTINKLFSYLIVFIISCVALIILTDTFKAPLINVFPNIEILLFNLFETLKDIKLFIIDLS